MRKPVETRTIKMEVDIQYQYDDELMPEYPHAVALNGRTAIGRSYAQAVARLKMLFRSLPTGPGDPNG